MERRKGWRFNLSAPIQFRWKLPSSLRIAESGITRDISDKGVFVFATTCPPLGRAIHMIITLPRLIGDSGLEIRANATVVRVERHDHLESGAGFAAVTKSYTLVNWHYSGQEPGEFRMPRPGGWRDW